MDQTLHYNHGSDPGHNHQSHQQRQGSLLFGESSLNAYALDAGGAQAHDMAAEESDHFRRDSMNSTALSPLSESKWETLHASQAVDINRRTSFAPTNPFRDDYSNPFPTSLSASAPSSATAPVHHGPNSWQFEHASGAASPVSFEPYSTSGDDFEGSDYPQPIDGSISGAGQASRQSSTAIPFAELHTDNVNVDTSPHSNSDWMALAVKDGQSRALPRHMRSGYRPARPQPSRASSDGIRKKNSRIDIPPDRNLGNIEELIEQARDDDEVKELKSQRRLLRNREAALMSRQRKKQHTEDLEIKENRYLKQINGLKTDLTELTFQHNAMDREYRMLHQKHTETCHLINAYEMEKEELIMKHTQESGRLRRQIQYLTEHFETSNDDERVMPAHTNFSDFTSNMNALTVDSQSWNPSKHSIDSTMMGQGPYPSAPEDSHVNVAQSDTIKPIKREVEQPIASGVLFMILLCGAFVASKSNNKPAIPNMPEEVRVASNSVLEHLLRDPRADGFTGNVDAPHLAPQAAAMHGVPQAHNSWDRMMMQQDGRQTLYRSLTVPTSQQEADQLFALSPAEYQSLTSPEEYVAHQPQNTAAPRRNLAETLAMVRQDSISKAPPAEVYTRSLLWDHIPAGIVKQFKELVKESKAAEDAGTGSQTRHDTMHDYGHPSTWTYPMGTS